MKRYAHSLVLLIATSPSIVVAAVNKPTDFKSLVDLITNIIGTLVVMVFVLTFLVFIWGIIKSWIIEGAEPEGIKEGKNLVVVSVIVLVIMTTIWGILTLLQNSFFGG